MWLQLRRVQHGMHVRQLKQSLDLAKDTRTSIRVLIVMKLHAAAGPCTSTSPSTS